MAKKVQKDVVDVRNAQNNIPFQLVPIEINGRRSFALSLAGLSGRQRLLYIFSWLRPAKFKYDPANKLWYHPEWGERQIRCFYNELAEKYTAWKASKDASKDTSTTSTSGTPQISVSSSSPGSVPDLTSLTSAIASAVAEALKRMN